jgi:hypothetical protein
MQAPTASDDGPIGRGAWASRLAGLCGLVVLIVACFGPVLFAGRQFAYRDAGHFYYPLYWSVQQQWRAGLLPLRRWRDSPPGQSPGGRLLSRQADLRGDAVRLGGEARAAALIG